MRQRHGIERRADIVVRPANHTIMRRQQRGAQSKGDKAPAQHEEAKAIGGQETQRADDLWGPALLLGSRDRTRLFASDLAGRHPPAPCLLWPERPCLD